MFLDDKKNKLKNWLNEIVEKHFSYGKDATEEDKQRTKKMRCWPWQWQFWQQSV